MLNTWLTIVSPMIYDSLRPILLSRNTVKNGVAKFTANTQAELKASSFLKLTFLSGF